MKRYFAGLLSLLLKQGTNANYRRLGCLLLTFFLLWALPGCGSDASAPEFPPTEETVQTVVEKLGWTLDPEGTQSWAEDQVLYSLESEDQTRVSVSCALVEGKRFLSRARAFTKDEIEQLKS